MSIIDKIKAGLEKITPVPTVEKTASPAIATSSAADLVAMMRKVAEGEEVPEEEATAPTAEAQAQPEATPEETPQPVVAETVPITANNVVIQQAPQDPNAMPAEATQVQEPNAMPADAAQTQDPNAAAAAQGLEIPPAETALKTASLDETYVNYMNKCASWAGSIAAHENRLVKTASADVDKDYYVSTITKLASDIFQEALVAEYMKRFGGAE